MTDILNLLNARASANASPQRPKPSTPDPHVPSNETSSTPTQPPMMPFPAAALMAAQANNPFIYNLIKHSKFNFIS